MRLTLPLLALLALLAGCSDDKEPLDSAAACEITVDETVPAGGTTDAYYRAAVEFHLSDPDPLATVSGTFAGTTSRSEDGEIIYYTPDAPLENNADHSATLSYCGGEVEVPFHTSDIGEVPLADPTLLIGRTWSFDLAAARIVAPDGMSLVLSTVPQQPLLIGVTAVGGGTIDFIEGASVVAGETQTQEYCLATTALLGADFSEDPYFSLSSPEATVAVGGAPVTVTNMQITGTFAADGSVIAGGVLSGTLDTRNMGVLVGDEGNPAAACTLMVSAGIRCGSCPDGEPYCIELLADQITAPEVVGLTVTPVVGVDCEGCADGPPDEDAVCE